MESSKLAVHCALVLFVLTVTLSVTEGQTTNSTLGSSTSTQGVTGNDTSTHTDSSTMTTFSLPLSSTTPRARGAGISITGSAILVSGCLAVVLRSVLFSR